MLAWIAAAVLIPLGGFIVTQGGKGLGCTLAGAGGVIILIKVIA